MILVIRSILWAILLSVVCVGCTSAPRFTSRNVSNLSPDGKHFLVEEGIASYYGEPYHGRKTSNGETYDMNTLTAAHQTLPFNTKVKVTNLSNQKSVVVRINDRGPFAKDRIIDLSVAAAEEIDMIGPGTARVRLDIIELGPELPAKK